MYSYPAFIIQTSAQHRASPKGETMLSALVFDSDTEAIALLLKGIRPGVVRQHERFLTKKTRRQTSPV